MADCIITFCRTEIPGTPNKAVPNGRDVRTCALAIGVSSVATTIAANSGEYVSILAKADCWIQVAETPVADALANNETQGISQWPMMSGQRLDLACQKGDKVAVIQA